MKLTLTVSENVGKKIISRGHTFDMADVMTSNNPAALFQKELVRMTEEVLASVEKEKK